MNTAETTVLKTHSEVNLAPRQIERFWKKVDKSTTPYGCWPWIGIRDKKGYGRCGLNYKIHFAHRIALYIATGNWPDKKMVCHHCDNPPCCNPDHLYAGTAKTNSADAIIRNRIATGKRHGSQTHPERVARGDRHGTKLNPSYLPKGEEVWNSKLTESDILKIKSMYASGEFRQWQIAELFKVRQGCISRILSGKTWKHVK